MEIKYNTSNVRMNIQADVFFMGARIGQIRKMLKMYRESGPMLEQVDEIKAWLEKGIQSEVVYQKEHAGACMILKSQLRELEEEYERMQSPCYAVCTRDKEKRAAKQKEIADCHGNCRRCLSAIAQSQKRQKRRQDVLADIKRILEGG